MNKHGFYTFSLQRDNLFNYDNIVDVHNIHMILMKRHKCIILIDVLSTFYRFVVDYI